MYSKALGELNAGNVSSVNFESYCGCINGNEFVTIVYKVARGRPFLKGGKGCLDAGRFFVHECAVVGVEGLLTGEERMVEEGVGEAGKEERAENAALENAAFYCNAYAAFWVIRIHDA